MVDVGILDMLETVWHLRGFVGYALENEKYFQSRKHLRNMALVSPLFESFSNIPGILSDTAACAKY